MPTPAAPMPLKWCEVLPCADDGAPLTRFALAAHTTRSASFDFARRLSALLRRLDTLSLTAFESDAKKATAEAAVLAELTPYLRPDFRPDALGGDAAATTTTTAMPASLNVYEISCGRPGGLLRTELVFKEAIRAG